MNNVLRARKARAIRDRPYWPCPACGGMDSWQAPDGRWLCQRCHPKPDKGDDYANPKRT